ncbi:hypothetical protein LO762_06850 [Actinocorallia sp. API 0066]|uniref:hypothetical protein n=1 Tax=Actinocorallia sp. API 0066 TaxID=2896846 RepID=UPI001E33F480|nr:hypothetical protein [Actinocorallia sp. API 0066]MCD0448908.1 hypothetical protein [Actinocorallia sp. API 0066]
MSINGAGTARATATGPSDEHARLAGLLLAGGCLIWAVSQIANFEREEDVVYASELIGGCFFMLGLFVFASLILSSHAAGDRKGKALPIVVMALAPIAIASSLGQAPHDSYADAPSWVVATDPSWPLSQLFMIISAIAIIRVGKWRGPLRFLPLGGSLWVIVTGVGEGVTDGQTGTFIFTAWMLATYVTAGVLLLVRPGAARGE